MDTCIKYLASVLTSSFLPGNLYMKKWKTVPDMINGFRIVKDLGINTKKQTRDGIVICKLCNKEFNTDLWKLHIRKSCGCYKVDQLGNLPSYINGFKIIKDLGHDGKRRALVECKKCKREYKVQVWSLVRRKHCGCAVSKPFKCSYRKSHPRLINIYKGMKARCYNEKDIQYKNYGMKGIIICEEWLNDADSFCEWALSNGYKDDLTIDRIENNKSYSSDNCRWSDITTQIRNRDYNKLSMEKANDIRKEIKNSSRRELAKKYGVCLETIRRIVLNKGWV